MSSSNRFRWSGPATILGGVLLPMSWIRRFVIGVHAHSVGPWSSLLPFCSCSDSWVSMAPRMRRQEFSAFS